MSWLRISHETAYRYSAPVRFGAHRLVLRPREGHDARVEEMRLEISPEFELEWSRDLFGNSVATVHFLAPADRLFIRSQVLLHQMLPSAQSGAMNRARVAFPVEFSELESSVAAAYLRSTYPDDQEEVRAWLASVSDVSRLADARKAVLAVGRAIRGAIQYRRREAKGVQTPGATLREKAGSCRDSATLMLEALRVIGLPARFASGYLDCAASEAGRASTHAWAEAYLPEIGWVGYDPSIGESTSAKHIVTGVSNHPRGVMPVSGTYFKEDGDYLGMEVAVRTERLDAGLEKG